MALGSVLVAGCARKSAREAALEAWRAEPGHKGAVVRVAFAPDSKTLYSLDFDGKVIVWAVETGRIVRQMQAQPRMVWTMALSADGKTLATGSFDKTVKIFEAGSGKELRTLTGHFREISGLAFSPDGKYLVSTDQHGVARLWDTSTWEPLQKWGHPPHAKPDDFIAESDPVFTSDGKRIVMGSTKQSVWVFETPTARVVRRLTVSLPPDVQARIGMSELALTHDNRSIVTTDMTGRMIRWDTRTWKQSMISLTGMPRRRFAVFWPRAVATSPDDKLLALAVGGNSYLVELATGKRLFTLSGHTGAVWALEFSADGKWLATGGTDNVVILWDVATGRAIRSLGTRPPPREMTEDY